MSDPPAAIIRLVSEFGSGTTDSTPVVVKALESHASPCDSAGRSRSLPVEKLVDTKAFPSKRSNESPSAGLILP